ncbi:MAG: hypothetical protein EBR82_66460 [Caulobacteraceae bacterium]|nr:hypothetical protein [Caulobacteraceae bacterium]
MIDMQMAHNLHLQKVVYHLLSDLLHYSQLMLLLQSQRELLLKLYCFHQIEHQFQQHTNDELQFRCLMKIYLLDFDL